MLQRDSKWTGLDINELNNFGLSYLLIVRWMATISNCTHLGFFHHVQFFVEPVYGERMRMVLVHLDNAVNLMSSLQRYAMDVPFRIRDEEQVFLDVERNPWEK